MDTKEAAPPAEPAKKTADGVWCRIFAYPLTQAILFLKGIFGNCANFVSRMSFVIVILLAFTVKLFADETNQPDYFIFGHDLKTNQISDYAVCTNSLIVTNDGRPRKLSEVRMKSVFEIQPQTPQNVAKRWNDYDYAIVKLMSDSFQRLIAKNKFVGSSSSWLKIEFHLHPNGEMTDLKAISGNTNSLFAYICFKSLKDCSPFPKYKLPDDERLIFINDFRKITFTFQ
jgi:hypothetical protein